MRMRGLIGAVLLVVGFWARAADYYWDGPDGTTWAATNNSGQTWWRLGVTNGAFSSVLPGDDDVCYHFKTHLLSLPIRNLVVSK